MNPKDEKRIMRELYREMMKKENKRVWHELFKTRKHSHAS